MIVPMTTENPRLQKFVADQTEAVKLARDETRDKPSDTRVEAINVALSIASTNRDHRETSVEEIITWARKIEAFFREAK